MNAKIMKISTLFNIDFNRVKTIIFDWGGVITNLSPQASVDAFRSLGHPSFEKYFQVGDDLFIRYETGNATDYEVYERLRGESGKAVTNEAVKKALCAMLLDTPPVRLEILRQLRSRYKLLLLSNTNPIHTRYYNNLLREHTGTDFYNFFDKIYYSYEIGMRKPSPEIFKYVVKDSGLSAAETLFIDDTEINIIAARSLDIRCLHLTDDTCLENIFIVQ